MKINTFEINSKDLFQTILFALLTIYLPLPWWKWVLYVGSVIGITLKWTTS